MSDLLKDLKTKDNPAKGSTAPVTLEELLLNENQVIQDVAEVSTEQDQEETVAKSRRERRKKLKTNRVVDRAKSSQSSRVQDRANLRRQEKNVSNLLDRQKASSPKKEVQKLEFVGSPRGQMKKAFNTTNKSDVKIVRPVLLGAFDFEPIRDGSGWTPAGNLLRLKRAVRQLKVDKQVSISINDTSFSEVPLVAALEEYSKSSELFRSNLNPSNISLYEEALTAFGLTVEDGASYTEILYTLMIEYNRALKAGSARLDESSDRAIEQGTSLVSSKDEKIESYVAALKGSDSQCYDLFVDADDDDIEISLKCMLSLLSKEALLSYNTLKYNSDDATTNNIEVTSLWARNLLMTKEDKNAIKKPSRVTANGNFTRKTAHGICFSGKDPETNRKTYNYPFEPSQIITADGTKTLTSFDFAERASNTSGVVYYGVNENGEIAEYETPYEATSDGLSRVSSQITSLFDTSSIGTGDSYAVSFLTGILGWMSLSAAVAPNFTKFMVGLQAMVEAAESKDILDEFMMYLAFRQEKIQDYDGVGDPLPGPATVLRRSKRLRKKLASAGSGRKKTTLTSNPRKVSVSPPPGESSGTKTFVSPEKRSQITTQDRVSSSDSGTLESIYDLTFEEVAARLAKKLSRRFSYNSVRFSVDPSKTLSIDEDIVKSALTDLTNAIFESMMNYSQIVTQGMSKIDDEDPKVFVESKSILNRYNESAFSVFFISICCKLAKLIVGPRASITTGSSMYARIKAPGVSKSSTSSGERTKVKVSSSYSTDLRELSEFLSSDERDTSDIIDTYPTLASIISSLAEEEEFLRTFASSLATFFSNVNNSFGSLRDALSAEIDGKKLSEYLGSVTPSSDLTKLMKTYPYFLNASDMMYNNVKVKNKTTSKDGFRSLLSIEQKKQRVLCIGIPAGLIEKTRYEPAEIEDVSSSAAQNVDDSVFSILIEKVDLTDPDIKYKDKEFEFSRNLFCIGADPYLAFLNVDNNFSCAKIWRYHAQRMYGDDIVKNHLTDFALKQYAELQLDANFFESSFTAGERSQSNKIDVPALRYVDTTTVEFLSASNLAFDPLSRSVSDMAFYSEGSIDIDKVRMEDHYEYSAFEFLNSYGVRFIPEFEQTRLNKGVLFEKVICVPIDDSTFELDLDDDVDDEQSSQESAAIQARLTSQDEVGIGLETSQGVDMYTYRVSLKVGREV